MIGLFLFLVSVELRTPPKLRNAPARAAASRQPANGNAGPRPRQRQGQLRTTGVSPANRLKLRIMARTEIQDIDREEVAEFIERRWHSKMVVVRGQSFFPHLEQGFIERRDGRIVGLLTYRMVCDTMELLTLNSTLAGQGIGSSLMLNAIEKARRQKCPRVCLTTTNDNLSAMGFYQRLGFRMTAVHVGAMDEARRIKPEIPKVGERGIEIHDEITLELALEPYLNG
jgi:ribosomal protein S18 acetylase RimI-like enzyme